MNDSAGLKYWVEYFAGVRIPFSGMLLLEAAHELSYRIAVVHKHSIKPTLGIHPFLHQDNTNTAVCWAQDKRIERVKEGRKITADAIFQRLVRSPLTRYGAGSRVTHIRMGCSVCRAVYTKQATLGH